MDIIKPSPKDICESIENSIDSISEKTLGYLLTKLTDINISPEDNDENILETAAMSNRIDLAELLIKKKAVGYTNSINKRGRYGKYKISKTIA